MILVALRTVIALTSFFKVQTCCTYYKTYQTAIQALSSEPLQPMLAKHGILIKQEWKLNFCLIGVIPLHDFAAWCAYGELVSCEVIRCQTWHVCTSSFSSFWCRMVGLPAPVYAHLWCMKVCHSLLAYDAHAYAWWVFYSTPLELQSLGLLLCTAAASWKYTCTLNCATLRNYVCRKQNNNNYNHNYMCS